MLISSEGKHKNSKAKSHTSRRDSKRIANLPEVTFDTYGRFVKLYCFFIMETDKGQSNLCIWYESNAFAAHLLIDNEGVYSLISYRYDVVQTARRFNVNIDLTRGLEGTNLGLRSGLYTCKKRVQYVCLHIGLSVGNHNEKRRASHARFRERPR